MKNTYNIVITETLRRIVPIEAESINEASDLARVKYYSNKIVLNSDDMIDNKIAIVGFTANEAESKKIDEKHYLESKCMKKIANQEDVDIEKAIKTLKTLKCGR